MSKSCCLGNSEVSINDNKIQYRLNSSRHQSLPAVQILSNVYEHIFTFRDFETDEPDVPQLLMSMTKCDCEKDDGVAS